MPGPIKVARARSTGTLIEVWRTEDFGLDPADGGPWLTVCEHGNNVQHASRKLAIEWSSAPETWCETGCRHAAEGHHCRGCGSKRMDFHGDNWICMACGDEWPCNCSDEETEMTEEPTIDLCPGQESTYVPWTMGESFECTTCGAHRIQHHMTQPLRNPSGKKDYDSIYPMPLHEPRVRPAG